MIATIILASILCVVLSCQYYAYKTGVPTVASFPRARKKIVAILKREFESRAQKGPYTIIDLGSGSGQLCSAIARALADARVLGLELSFFPWLRAVTHQRFFGPSNLEFRRQDFWSYDCVNADAVVIFLNGKVLEQSGRKLRRELKSGALIVVNEDRLGGDWKPVETVDNPILGVFHSKIYIYRQP